MALAANTAVARTIDFFIDFISLSLLLL